MYKVKVVYLKKNKIKNILFTKESDNYETIFAFVCIKGNILLIQIPNDTLFMQND